MRVSTAADVSCVKFERYRYKTDGLRKFIRPTRVRRRANVALNRSTIIGEDEMRALLRNRIKQSCMQTLTSVGSWRMSYSSRIRGVVGNRVKCRHENTLRTIYNVVD